MKCPFDPKVYAGEPIGQFHCPECGLMVLGGLDHPEICKHGEEVYYKDICDICTPEWDKGLFPY